MCSAREIESCIVVSSVHVGHERVVSLLLEGGSHTHDLAKPVMYVRHEAFAKNTMQTPAEQHNGSPILWLLQAPQNIVWLRMFPLC